MGCKVEMMFGVQSEMSKMCKMDKIFLAFAINVLHSILRRFEGPFGVFHLLLDNVNDSFKLVYDIIINIKI